MGKRLRIILLFVIICQFCFVSCQSNKRHKKDEKELSNMSNTLQYNTSADELVSELKSQGIKDERILKAIAKIPRDEFVSENLKSSAYVNKALPIAKGQTISQPYTVAYQTDLKQ